MADRLFPSTKTLPFLGLWTLIDVWSLFRRFRVTAADRGQVTLCGTNRCIRVVLFGSLHPSHHIRAGGAAGSVCRLRRRESC